MLPFAITFLSLSIIAFIGHYVCQALGFFKLKTDIETLNNEPIDMFNHSIRDSEYGVLNPNKVIANDKPSTSLPPIRASILRKDLSDYRPNLAEYAGDIEICYPEVGSNHRKYAGQQAGLMYCNKCGISLPSNSRYCSGCGEDIRKSININLPS